MAQPPWEYPESILTEAIATVDGRDKAANYGPVEDSIPLIAKMFTIILSKHLRPGAEVDAPTAVVMMAGLKVMRLAAAPGHRDSQIDLAGYSRILERLTAGGAHKRISLSRRKRK